MDEEEPEDEESESPYQIALRLLEQPFRCTRLVLALLTSTTCQTRLSQVSSDTFAQLTF